jgi:hypothetical protein
MHHGVTLPVADPDRRYAVHRKKWIVYCLLAIVCCSIGVAVYVDQLSRPEPYFFMAAADSCFSASDAANAERLSRKALAVSAWGDAGLFERTQAMLGLARAVSAQGRDREADSLAARALNENERAYGTKGGRLVNVLKQLREYYVFACQDSMAERCDTRAEEIAREAAPRYLSTEIAEARKSATQSDLAEALVLTGILHLHNGQPQLAAAAYDSAIVVLRAAFGHEDARVYETYYRIAKLWSRYKHPDEALGLYRLLQTRQESKVGPNSIQLVELLDRIATIELAQGSYAGAEAHLSRIISLQESHLGPVDLVPYLRSLAEAQAGQKRFARALGTRRRVLEINRHLYYPGHPQIGLDLLFLADIELQMGRISEARENCGQALEIFTQALGPGDHRVEQCRRLLGRLSA